MKTSQNYTFELLTRTTENHRITWNQNYYTARTSLLSKNQLKNSEEVHQYMENITLLIELFEFKSEFRSKLFSFLKDSTQENSEQKVPIFHIFLTYNLTTKKLQNILEVFHYEGHLNSETFDVSDLKKLNATLSDEEIKSLGEVLQPYLSIEINSHFDEIFGPFLPHHFTKETVHKHRSQNPKTLFPYLNHYRLSPQPYTLQQDNYYILNDMYCCDPHCDCNEVNCFIQNFSEEKENTLGAFRYNFTKQNFKPLSEFPNKLNFKEWFKKFNETSIIDLDLLLTARYSALRGRHL